MIYSAFADAGLGVRAAIAGADAVLPKSASPRALLAVLRGELRPPLDPRALRALGERLEPTSSRSSACSPTASPRTRSRRRWASRRSAPAARAAAQMLARLDGRGARSPPPEPPCDNRRMPTRDQILEALKVVIDPELHNDIVTLGMVRSIDIAETVRSTSRSR